MCPYQLGEVDLLEDEDDLENEQTLLDEHDHEVTWLFDRLVCLTILVQREVKADPQQDLLKRLQHLVRNLQKVTTEVSTPSLG